MVSALSSTGRARAGVRVRREERMYSSYRHLLHSSSEGSIVRQTARALPHVSAEADHHVRAYPYVVCTSLYPTSLESPVSVHVINSTNKYNNYAHSPYLLTHTETRHQSSCSRMRSEYFSVTEDETWMRWVENFVETRDCHNINCT